MEGARPTVYKEGGEEEEDVGGRFLIEILMTIPAALSVTDHKVLSTDWQSFVLLFSKSPNDGGNFWSD